MSFFIFILLTYQTDAGTDTGLFVLIYSQQDRKTGGYRTMLARL